MRLLAAVILALAVAAPAAHAADDKVLVIGIGGARADIVQQVIDAGHAPNLAALEGEGFLTPSLLEYAPPQSFTLDEVGWATIATGVWPVKHGIHGFGFDADPNQAFKNGYPDFLTRTEQLRPRLNTYLATAWDRMGVIFGGGDARYVLNTAHGATANDIADELVTRDAVKRLATGNPDLAFVTYRSIDEIAHESGSASTRYAGAVETTDGRIGRLLAAVRDRRTYERERWLVLLATDHGQQALPTGAVFSHGGGSALERTAFVGLAAYGSVPTPANPQVIDIAPSVYAWLGLPKTDGLDGKALAQPPAVPKPTATTRRTRRSVTVTVDAPQGAPDIRAVTVSAGGRDRVFQAPDPRTVVVRMKTKRPVRRVSVAVTDTTGRTTKL